ncbi:MAG: hypothetical protein EA377_10385 [Phycisphaerales bacterium]|nr:MAG: hypothetical protein EA377_10385 [Phycisphaerales bacterium]
MAMTCVLSVGAIGWSLQEATAGSSDWSAARVWNEMTLESIRNDRARPPVHARNLYHTSAAMYDAWAVYDDTALGVFYTEKYPAPRDVKAAREEAISYAAYRILKYRFEQAAGAKVIQPMLDDQFSMMGYDATFTSTEGDSPAAIGNRIAQIIIETGWEDGSNELNNFAPLDPFTLDPYQPVNEPIAVANLGLPLDFVTDPNRWASTWLETQVDQAGNIIAGNVPVAIGPHWGYVTPFALREEHLDAPGLYLDPGAPPMLDTERQQEYIDTFADVIVTSSQLDPDLGIMIDISPAVFGKNPLGSNDGQGYGKNPVTGEPYPPNVINYGDYGRIVAEFWADGPQSSTPPGHWNEIANELVADSPIFEHRIGGEGPIVDRLEWDVKMYLMLNGATHDAAVACWGVKGFYDYVRPVYAIRYMAERGQSSDPNLPSYHPHGLPLIPGIIELITEETAAPGGKHAHLAEMVVDEFGFAIPDENGENQYDVEQFIGEIAVMAWPGSPSDNELAYEPISYQNIWTDPQYHQYDASYSGVQWILAKRWSTYQLATFITPPFPGYTSGHTTFSRAAAVALSELTGSPYFPGGLGEYHIQQGDFLDFEYGPSQDVTLQWARYFDCSDQSARSRIYGGIHPYVDDFPARFQGQKIGEIASAKAFELFGIHPKKVCVGDLTDSGDVNVFDLLMLLSQWGRCDGCEADLMTDGMVDVFDLLILLENWGACN